MPPFAKRKRLWGEAATFRHSCQRWSSLTREAQTVARSAAGPGGDANLWALLHRGSPRSPFLQGRCSATSAAAAGPWTGKRRDLRSALEQLLKRASNNAATCNSHASRSSSAHRDDVFIKFWIKAHYPAIARAAGKGSPASHELFARSHDHSVVLSSDIWQLTL